MERCGLLLLCGFVLSGVGQRAPADDSIAAPAHIDFNRDIRPILSNRCFKCHGPDLKKAGLDLQNRQTALRQLKSGNFAIAVSSR